MFVAESLLRITRKQVKKKANVNRFGWWPFCWENSLKKPGKEDINMRVNQGEVVVSMFGRKKAGFVLIRIKKSWVLWKDRISGFENQIRGDYLKTKLRRRIWE